MAQWAPCDSCTSTATVCAFAVRLGETAGLRLEDVDFLRRTISCAAGCRVRTAPTTQL